MKRHAISFAHTFIATFLTTLGAIIIAIPAESFSDPKVWTSSFVAGIIVGAVRAAVKSASETFIQE